MVQITAGPGSQSKLQAPRLDSRICRSRRKEALLHRHFKTEPPHVGSYTSALSWTSPVQTPKKLQVASSEAGSQVLEFKSISSNVRVKAAQTLRSVTNDFWRHRLPLLPLCTPRIFH